jgi:UDP-2,4-diacetamido-2,4,6-trideoxy-beta-L-altropyranose hydrolase
LQIKKKILFRADGNSTTGLGHLYRLFALVEMLRSNYDFIFITKEDSTKDVIPNYYTVKFIPNSISLLNEANWLAENHNPDSYIVVLDGYQFNTEYQLSIKNSGFKQVYIDDLEEYVMHADLIINHSSASKEDNFNAPKNSLFGLGTQYALLRPEFLKEASKVAKERKEVSDVFVCFGGADIYNLTFKTVKSLLKIPIIKSIHVVIGAAYRSEALNDLVEAHSDIINVYKNLSELELIKVMKKTNLAIVPTSTIFYEIACLKIPTISGYFVNNQIGVYNWFNTENCFYGVNDFTTLDFSGLNEIINVVNKNSNNYISNQAKVIDGNQKDRLLKLFNKLN